MRHSELRTLMDEHFGPAHAATIARDHVLTDLGGRTVEAALAHGIPVKDVWTAVCAEFAVPPARRHGPQWMRLPSSS